MSVRLLGPVCNHYLYYNVVLQITQIQVLVYLPHDFEMFLHLAQCKLPGSVLWLLSAAERRGTPVLLGEGFL